MGKNGMEESNSIIKIENIRKFYRQGENRLEVLKGISLEVNAGEYLAVLGPSGSGKSTLMNILGCMDRFQSGKYWLDGQSVNGLTDAQLTRLRNRKIGFIFQRYHLIQKYTVLQNTMIPLLARGVPARLARELSMRKLEMLGMADRSGHRPNELSGGQQQRAAIARALVGSPKLLLADEPTGALDRANGRDVLGLFRQLNEAGNTIVMITHDPQVAAHARRTIHIVDGELFEDKKPAPFQDSV
jgi:putative ABC transport system ATP-binding protein